MGTARPASPVRSLLLFLLGGLVGVNATYFLMKQDPVSPASVALGQTSSQDTPQSSMPIEVDRADTSQHQAGQMLPPPVATIRGPAMAAVAAPTMGIPNATSTGLLVPVQGVTASQLSDTFNDARSAGRSHDAIDIMAAAGTPVLAVADGHVEKFFNSKLGGLTIYEFNTDGTLAYYYAHLQRYADGLSEQQAVTRGQLIGYVGSTGDASPDAPHLHFAIFELGPEKQWWKGEAINPYPELGGIPR